MAFLNNIKQWFHDLSRLFFPNLCEVCDTPLAHGEETMCLKCRYNLPLCNITNTSYNFIHQRLMRHVPINLATAYFFYHRNSSYTNLILSAKYRGRPKIVQLLAEEFAKKIIPTGFFNGIDIIIPVPMHRTKKAQRGYNQTDYIARGLSNVSGIRIGDNIVATKNNSTQTRKGAYNRWLNAQNRYSIKNPEQLSSLHILLIDDVITTGATLMACAEALHKASPSTTISILTLAATELQ